MTNDLSSVYTGGQGFTATGIEFDPSTDVPTGTLGTAASVSAFVSGGMNNTLQPKFERDKAKVQTNTHYAERINEPSYLTVEGTDDWFTNGDQGNEYWFALLDAQADVPQQTGATTGGTTTTNGVSDHTISETGYVIGAPVEITKSGVTESGIITATSSGHVFVTGLDTLGTAASGATVDMPKGVQIAHSLLPDVNQNLMAYLTVHRIMGGIWDWRFRSVTCEGIDIEISTGLVKAQAKLFGAHYPDYLTSDTDPVMPDYSPDSTVERNALLPFTAMNASIAIGTDDAGTGTSAVRAAFGIKSLKFSYNKGIIKEKIVGNPVIQPFPGDDAALSVSWNELDTMDRPYLLDDYIRVSGGFSVFAGLKKNVGTLGSPTMKYLTLYAPYVRPEDSKLVDNVSTLGQWENTAAGMVIPGVNDLLQVYVVNGS